MRVLCTKIERCKVEEWMINSEALPNKPRASILKLDIGTQPKYHFLLLTTSRKYTHNVLAPM